MRRKQRFIITLIVLIGLLTTIGGILGSLATNLLSQEVKLSSWYVLSLLGVVTLVGISLTVWQYRLQVDIDHSTSALDRRNRQRMREKVQAFWIEGVLEQSLHGAALIALGLQKQPDAVANPWHLVIQQLDQTYALPPGTHIVQAYDNMGCELLILGEPGCGKTTLLLELTRDLLERSRLDDTHPIPVVFNLSSWAVKRQPITEWLVEELNTKYQVPRKLGQVWVEANQIMPLLDGLDEVTPTHHEECIKTINAFRKEHGLVPIVVCSRKEEYLNASMLNLRNCHLGHACHLVPSLIAQLITGSIGLP